MDKILWTPSQAFLENSNLRSYALYLKDALGLEFIDYEALHAWSVKNPSVFWESILRYFKVKFEGSYTNVLQGQMPEVEWFKGIHLNYVEHMFSHESKGPAIFSVAEAEEREEVSWEELRQKSGALAGWLKAKGVQKGDRVAAYLPNCSESTIAFIATASIGAVWSSCSPDFGVASVKERFGQIEPKVLFASGGYAYGGKYFDRRSEVEALKSALTSVVEVVDCTKLGKDPLTEYTPFSHTVREKAELRFERVPFSHPLWILYSSGTTGKPKAIVHSHGGCLLEHLKYLAFHNDVHAGERFFWYSTTGWMMWNFTQAALLLGASIVLYDGSPAYPRLQKLWSLIDEFGIHHFGTSAPYIVSCMQKGLKINSMFNLKTLRTVSSTGSPLPPEGFDYVYNSVKSDVWLCSISGGTDVVTAFVGGVPWKKVKRSKIQGRSLGADIYAVDDLGGEVVGEVGELVLKSPMPSMPVYFWNDDQNVRYKESYFAENENVWHHGDWIELDKDGQVQIFGRSDATLNRHGVRIGTAEIYNGLPEVPEVVDALIVNLERENGSHYMPLFVKLRPGMKLGHELTQAIKARLRANYSPRHVPDAIYQVQDIPYTLSGKKMETPVKRILMGKDVHQSLSLDAMRNPQSLDFFKEFAETHEGK